MDWIWSEIYRIIYSAIEQKLVSVATTAPSEMQNT